MTSAAADESLLEKARESLAGAEAEFAAGRYNNCANRCYYACFQAAVVALLRAGIRPPNPDGRWSHARVQAQIDGELIGRRKVLAAGLRGHLSRAYALRQLADYNAKGVTAVQASRAVAHSREFLRSALGSGGLP